MTLEEHRQKHVELHRSLDLLFADFIACNPDKTLFLDTPLREFIGWSHKQTINPTPAPGTKHEYN